ncbi:uncharacterized protein [Aristolochia californica]|uniref:uncharacterized protein n=1 Tax=Aristolochia californica TaxID=171875 RepID=UPI0035DD41D4
MNNRLLLHPQNPAFQYEWTEQNVTTTFFKCTQWEVQETTDLINCPYHYFCDSFYPGNYSPIIDFLVLIFAAVSYMITISFTLLETRGGNLGFIPSQSKRRYWIPSGPISLPLTLLALAKGQRINTIFPLSNVGPALLQLVYVSALAFEYTLDKSIKYVIFEVSIVSGVLHASLYLDSIILPYYTGLEALVFSTFSGLCVSCVCRRKALVVGGNLITYRGWSGTMFCVVATLCSRLIYRFSGEDNRRVLLMKYLLEGFSWVLIATDCVYLMVKSPEGELLVMTVFGSILLLVCIHLLKKMHRVFASLNGVCCKRKRDKLTTCEIGAV